MATTLFCSSSDMDRKKQTCSRVVQTVCVTWALFMVGISDSLLGPSLLDLQALLQTDLGSLNYIVLATGLSDFVGAILAGFLAKTADVHLRLSLSVLLGSLAIGVSALIANYYYVLVVFSFQGLIRGIVFCYSIEKCNNIWRNKGVSFQFVSLGPTTGGVIAPLFINLFLCSSAQQQTEPEIMLHNSSSILYDTDYNVTYTLTASTLNDTSTNNSTVQSCLPQDVRISYAYIILGCICTPPVAGFLVYWRMPQIPERSATDSSQNEEESNLHSHRTLETVLAVLFVIYYFPILGGSIVFSTFLTEFGVKGPLHLIKTKMVLMTSLYWGSSLAGRIINIFLTPWLGVEKIIILNIIPLLIFETILISSVAHSEIILWVCTCAIGLFISPFVGTGYAWCAGHIKLAPIIIAASGATLGLGGMAIPFVGGVCFEHFGPMSFLYFFYANYIFMACMFLIMFILGRKLKQQTSVVVGVDPTIQPLKADD